MCHKNWLFRSIFQMVPIIPFPTPWLPKSACRKRHKIRQTHIFAFPHLGKKMGHALQDDFCRKKEGGTHTTVWHKSGGGGAIFSLVRGYLSDRNPSVSLYFFKNTTLRLQAHRQNFSKKCKSLRKVKYKKSQLSDSRSLQKCMSLRPIHNHLHTLWYLRGAHCTSL